MGLDPASVAVRQPDELTAEPPDADPAAALAPLAELVWGPLDSDRAGSG
jgi:hypothetical protein